jgi:hypothetical protein
VFFLFFIIEIRPITRLIIVLLENPNPSFPINDLPNEIVVKILDKLCYADLCVTKKVSKRFNELAEESWMNKKSISFDKASLLGKSSTRCTDLTLTTKTKTRILNSLCTKSLFCLTLFEMNDEKNRHAFYAFIKSNGAAGLKELKLTGSFFTDKVIEAVAKHCQKLERLTLSCADEIPGSCFSKFSSSMTAVEIVQCQGILNKHYLQLFKKCKSLTRLVITIGETDTIKFMETIVQCLPMLEVLHIEMMNKSDEECYEEGLEEIELPDIELVCSLSNLRELKLKNVSLTDQQLAKIMNECTQLKTFQLFDYRDVLELSNKAFTALPILAPLECIALKTDASFVDNYVMIAVQAQCADTLERLELDGNRKVSNECLIKLFKSCKRLDYFGLAQTRCDNSLLEKVLALDRQVYLDCRGSHVNVLEFLESNSLSLGMLKEAGDKSCGFEVKVSNLTINICVSECVPLADGQIVRELSEFKGEQIARHMKELRYA